MILVFKLATRDTIHPQKVIKAESFCCLLFWTWWEPKTGKLNPARKYNNALSAKVLTCLGIWIFPLSVNSNTREVGREHTAPGSNGVSEKIGDKSRNASLFKFPEAWARNLIKPTNEMLKIAREMMNANRIGRKCRRSALRLFLHF